MKQLWQLLDLPLFFLFFFSQWLGNYVSTCDKHVTSQLPVRNRKGQRAFESFTHATYGNYGICDYLLTFRAVDEVVDLRSHRGPIMLKPTYLYVSTCT
jgi:hypothetical protein